MFAHFEEIHFVYWLLLAIMALGTFAEGYYPYKPRKRLQIVAVIFFILVSGLRYGMSDYIEYRGVYYLDYFQFEPGYEFLQNLGINLGLSFEVFLFLFTVISFIFLKKALSGYWFFFGMMLVLAKLTTFYAMSGMRQWMALCICFYAISILLKGQRWRFVFWVLIAYTIHRSAFIVLPLIFLYNREFSFKLAFFTILAAAGIGMFSKEFLFAASEASELFDASGYLLDNEGSINALNWIENLAFLTAGLLIRGRVKDRVPHYDFFLYMLLIYCAFLIAGSEFGIIKRLRDYYVLSYYIIVPSIGLIFRKEDRGFFKAVVVFYFALLFIRSLDYFWQIAHYKNVLFLGPEDLM